MFQDGSDGPPTYSLPSRVPRSELEADASQMCAGTAPFPNGGPPPERPGLPDRRIRPTGHPGPPMAAAPPVAASDGRELHRPGSRLAEPCRLAIGKRSAARPGRLNPVRLNFEVPSVFSRGGFTYS